MSDALDALARGNEARASGDLAEAEMWLRRAQRAAPGNATVLLSLAAALAQRRDPEAEQLFRAVAHADGAAVAWLGLVAACLSRGAAGEAADALARLLSRHAQDPAAIAPVADQVMRLGDMKGWVALDGAGGIHVGLAQPARAARQQPVAELDGRPIALRRRTTGGGYVGVLPEGWEAGRAVTVRYGDDALLGSPVAVPAIARVEGFVDTTDGDLHGWAWSPNNPNLAPRLAVVAGNGRVIHQVVADDEAVTVPSSRAFARPRGFRVSADALRDLAGPVRVVGRDGRNLVGSPLHPVAERMSAVTAARIVAGLFPAPGAKPGRADWAMPLPSAPADVVGPAPSGGAKRRPVDVVVPVYQSLELTVACILSVLAGLPRWARLVVVDDASPDPQVAKTLEELARKHRFVLRLETQNRGFPSTANIGMRHDGTRDVVLLNSDTLVPPGWLARLRDAAYSDPRIGSATPLSNDATILSYPSVLWANPVPDQGETTRLDGFAQAANDGMVVDIPTGVGFCMYIKRDCLAATGLLREDLFAQGYGEENDFCIRARHLGWRHVATPGIFVAHVGGQSFGETKQHLISRNLRLLNRLHPGYDALVQAWQRADPLAAPRKAIDMARWRSLRTGAPAVLMVTHGRGGGVQRRLSERAGELRAAGLRPIVLWPDGRREGDGRDCVLGDGPEGGTPNLRFRVPEDIDALCALLAEDGPVRGEVHHLIGHDHGILEIFRRLAVPYEVVIHDYSWFCPRINLVRDDRYCGEPDAAQCEHCVDDHGTTNDEPTRPHALRQRSGVELEEAARIIVPARDVATRLRNHFPRIAPEVVPWEDDAAFPDASPAAFDGGELRVVVVGAIGVEKGYRMLLACARDAAERALPLQFHLVGYSMDDARLLETGRVRITGRYEEHEAVALIRNQRPHLAWLTSIWPETWCYTLTQAWMAGVDVVAFDIGAQAERIRRTGRGSLVPLGISPAALNSQLARQALLRVQPGLVA